MTNSKFQDELKQAIELYGMAMSVYRGSLETDNEALHSQDESRIDRSWQKLESLIARCVDINDVWLMSTDVEEVTVPDVIEMPSGDLRKL
jgi:hypothetical protein